jgi:hypothetical protein
LKWLKRSRILCCRNWKIESVEDYNNSVL